MNTVRADPETFEAAWAAVILEQRRPGWDRSIRKGVRAFWRWWIRTKPR